MAWGKVEHLCNEACGTLILHFVRRGTGLQDVSVEWHTENVNLIPESYTDFKGAVIIRAGEFSTTVKLKIADNGLCLPACCLSARQVERGDSRHTRRETEAYRDRDVEMDRERDRATGQLDLC